MGESTNKIGLENPESSNQQIIPPGIQPCIPGRVSADEERSRRMNEEIAK